MTVAISPVMSRIQNIQTRMGVPSTMQIGAQGADGDFGAGQGVVGPVLGRLAASASALLPEGSPASGREPVGEAGRACSVSPRTSFQSVQQFAFNQTMEDGLATASGGNW